jgi:hypothetical protein
MGEIYQDMFLRGGECVMVQAGMSGRRQLDRYVGVEARPEIANAGYIVAILCMISLSPQPTVI